MGLRLRNKPAAPGGTGRRLAGFSLPFFFPSCLVFVLHVFLHAKRKTVSFSILAWLPLIPEEHSGSALTNLVQRLMAPMANGTHSCSANDKLSSNENSTSLPPVLSLETQRFQWPGKYFVFPYAADRCLGWASYPKYSLSFFLSSVQRRSQQFPFTDETCVSPGQHGSYDCWIPIQA